MRYEWCPGIVSQAESNHVPRAQPLDAVEALPNPNAIVPNWRTHAGPFLNEKTCDYSAIVITCKACGDDFELASGEYLESGIRILLKFYNKVESDSNVETLIEVAQVADHHLGGDALIPRKTSVMKVLITVPACDFNLIEDERSEQVKEEGEEEPEEPDAPYELLKDPLRRHPADKLADKLADEFSFPSFSYPNF